MQNIDLELVVAGEGALLIYLAKEPSDGVLDDIQKLREKLHGLELSWLKDTIPSFTSLLIEYDPLMTDHFVVSKVIRALSKKLAEEREKKIEYTNPIVDLPVYYSEETGFDLADVATKTGMTIDDVIRKHSNTVYRIYAVGFAPGFTYLGPITHTLALPRLKTPRIKVPKGSVAIAEQQTAIYPQDSPGGWHIVGNCPVSLFDSELTPPMRFSVGDQVRFSAISRDEFIRLGGKFS